MTRLWRGVLHGALLLVACATVLVAQQFRFDDATMGQKVALFTQAGDELGISAVPGTAEDGLLVNLGSNNGVIALLLASFVDDADFADGTSESVLGGCVAEQASPTTVTEGDTGACAMTLNRAQKVTLYNSSGTELTSGDATHDIAATSSGPQTMGECDDTATDAVDEGDAGKARVDCTTRALLAAVLARTSGGCTWDSQISTAAVLERQVKATAGQVYAIQAYSLDATPVYLKLYNDTAANVDETDTPVARFLVPATALGGTNNIPVPAVGTAFSTAITYRVTTGFADNDTGALTANEVIVNVCSF